MLKRTLLFSCFVCTFFASMHSVANGQTWLNEDSRFPAFNRLIQRYKELKPALEKQSIAESERDRLLGEFRQLKYDAQQLHFNAATTPNTSEELKFRYQFLVESLGYDISKLSEIPLSRSPVPDAPVDPWNSVGFSDKVEAYRLAEEELRTHLCLEPVEGSAQERDTWRSDLDELLLKMILAEEKLAFAASGSFTRDDHDGLRPIFRDRKQDEIRRLLAEAARNDRVAEKLRPVLEQYDAVISRFSMASDGNARSGGVGLAILLLGMRRVQYDLDQVEFLSTQAKTRIIAPLQEITDAAASVYANMHARGITEINRRLGTGITPFRIHRPVGSAQREKVERRLVEYVYREMGIRLPFERTAGFPESAILQYTLFDEAEKRRFVRNECRDASVASLRLTKSTVFSPGEGVEVAYVTPLNLRGKVWVGLMRSSESHRNIRYINSETNITQFQPKSLESRPDGVFEYSAPSLDGSYDVRMFEKESGKEVASVKFKVDRNPLRRVTGVWQFKIACPQAHPKCEGYLVVPGKPYTFNIFTVNESNYMGGISLKGTTFTATTAWFWTGDQIKMEVSPDRAGNISSMRGTWLESFNRTSLPAVMTRLRPQVQSATVTRLNKNLIAVDFRGTGLPIDAVIHGKGMVELDVPGMSISKWYRVGETDVMRVEIQHEDGVKPGERRIQLNGVDVAWTFK